MTVRRTERFRRSYDAAPVRIKQAFEKQVTYLAQDIRHPSLRAKKYDEAQDIWQARVTQDWRFYFQIEGATYVLLDIMKHPK
jgi:hypothetical protein